VARAQKVLRRTLLVLVALVVAAPQGRKVFALPLHHRGARIRELTANAALLEAGRHGLIDTAREILPLVHDEGAIEFAMCGAAGSGSIDILELLRSRLARIPTLLVICVIV
jgi:hypothetical protein